jgi:hypothetical protein
MLGCLLRNVENYRNHIKKLIEGCTSIQLEWININKHIISEWLCSPRRIIHVITCSPIRHLSSDNGTERMSFSQRQRVFIVEHNLANLSHLNCQNYFMDTLSDYPVPTIRQHLVWWTSFITANIVTEFHQTRQELYLHSSLNAMYIFGS